MRCAACGYVHEPGTHCPLCACGKLPSEHIMVTVPSPACPGKAPSETTGKLPQLRRGSFRDAADPVTYRERADGVLVPVIEVEPEDVEDEPVLPPRVPARLTVSLDEIASRAKPLGAAAADTGWIVTPWYWVDGAGVETSALVMHRDVLRAVAYWHRAPGATWKTGGARAWRSGDWPTEVGVTRLLALIKEMSPK